MPTQKVREERGRWSIDSYYYYSVFVYTEVLINRQLQSKWKLSTELDKYRKRLDTMQRDVRALEMPLPASAPDQLQEEIKRLQTVCDRMAAAVEEAGNFGKWEIGKSL